MTGSPHGGIHPAAHIGTPPVDREHRDDVNAVLWHPPAIHETAMVEAGAVVQDGVKAPTMIGPRAWIMNNAVISHDAWVDEGAEIYHLAFIGGFAYIGPEARIYTSSVIAPFRKIGKGAVVGANSFVDCDVPPYERWWGNPAKRRGMTEWEEWFEKSRSSG